MSNIIDDRWIEQSIYTAFYTTAKQYPSKPALINKELTISYAQLLTEVQRYASALKKRCGEGDEPIAIWLPNDHRFIVCMLAVTSLGRAYLPLDYHFPWQRNIEILELSAVSAVISSVAVLNEPVSLNFIDIDELAAAPEDSQYVSVATQDDLSYIIYTSGSTGKPKGVYQNQRNMLHDVMQYIQAIGLNSDDRCTLFYSPAVNGAIRDIYGALLCGATLCLANLKADGIAGIGAFLNSYQITVYHSLPGIFRAFLMLENNAFESVRLVYLAGDRIFSSDLSLFQSFFNTGARLYVGIGSTENATIYCQWLLDHTTQVFQPLLPLGYPVKDREFKIIAADNAVAAIGQEGQIVVTSRYMSLGYWRNPELTQQWFIQNPDGSRTFRTGDIGYIQPDGMLYFLGRNDNQVKINGYRVEVDEVSEKIKQLAAVKNACVIVKKERSSQKLIAFVELMPQELTIVEIKAQLSAMMPSYMLPAHIQVLDHIPMLDNFKVDYQQLKSKAGQQTEIAKSHDYDVFSDVLKKIWLSYIENPSDYEADCSFAEAGGSSIEIVYLIVEIEKKLKIEVPAKYISSALTPSSLLKLISELTVQQITTDKVNDCAIYIFSPLHGLSADQIAFIKKLGAKFNVSNIQYTLEEGWSTDDIILTSTGAVIEKFSGQLIGKRTIFLGICNGNLLAQSVAAHLPLGCKPLLHVNLDHNIPTSSHLTLSKRVSNFTTNISKHGFRYTLGTSALLRFQWLKKADKSRHERLVKAINTFCSIEAQPPNGSLRTNNDGFKYTDIPLLFFVSADNVDKEFYDEKFWNKYYKDVSIIKVPYVHLSLLSKINSQNLIISNIQAYFENRINLGCDN